MIPSFTLPADFDPKAESDTPDPTPLHAAATPPDLAASAPFYPPHVARRRDGWTAERQRRFLAALADTGCVTLAAASAGITPRSAHRLRNHPAGAPFARAWDAAMVTAAGRLVTVAFERAIQGTPREVWKDDILVKQTRVPSDRMLMFLLARLVPDLFAEGADPAARAAALAARQARLAPALAGLTDAPVFADLIENVDFAPEPPGEYEP